MMMKWLLPTIVRNAGGVELSARAGQRLRARIPRGFTLVELMIVVAIVAILAAIAYPSYTRYVTKTRRVAAQACLSQYASYMERWYTTNLSYAGVTTSNWPALDCASNAQTGNNYTYSLSSAATASSYTLQAAPIGGQLAGDTQCGTLTLNNQGVRTPSTAGCW
jgi:type IV pilus assembly protein PilE